MKLRSRFASLIGTKAFYKMVLAVAIPMMIQQGITNFVSLLDNIMVGQVGTDQMSGVSIANQLMMVYNLCIFGGTSGAGIFVAQFFGGGNHRGVRSAFQFKLIVALIVTVVAELIFIFAGPMLIQSFLHEGSATGNIQATMVYSRQYMLIMLVGLPAMALSQCYTSTLRETGQTVLPMVSGIAAVLVNLCFNYILIYGKFGAPAMGASGAAVATVLSRYVELTISAVWTHRHTAQAPFIVGAWRKLDIPSNLCKQIIRKGMPLLVNEFLWSLGMTLLSQSYSTRGLATVAAINITSTITQLFNVIFMTMGSSVSIIIGQKLGSGDLEGAKKEDKQLIAFSVASSVAIALLLLAFGPLFPRLYNTTEEVRSISTQLIWIAAALMPFNAFTHAAYFTLRSGGKTMVTFVFDSMFVCVVMVPIAWCLSRLTGLPIVPLYAICQGSEILKCIVGFIMLRSGVWVNNIVADTM